MFIQRNAFMVSIIIHILLFFLLLFYYQRHVPPLTIIPERRLVSLTIQSRAKNITTPAVKPYISETVIPVKPQESIKPSESVKPLGEQVKDNPIQEKKGPESKTVISKDIVELTPVEESRSYVYSVESIIPLDDNPVLPMDEPALEDLLIDEPQQLLPSDSLFSFDLKGNQSRGILNMPEILFDSSDPALATLENCKISFHITREGMVRDIKMIPPGTGSITYDEILENLLSQFLFVPGEADQGVIYINFSHVKGNVNE